MDRQDVIVIKIGTGVLTKADGTLDTASLARLVNAVADLPEHSQRVVLVSSGAVGAGIPALGLSEYPDDVPTRQAAAALGQTRLMHAYETLFRSFDVSVAQLLLTATDLESEGRRKRVFHLLTRLITEPGIVPIINENDSVAVEELSVGDNDMLSARVASLLGAKLLVLLTSVDGLMPPGSEDIVTKVERVDDVLSYANAGKGRFAIGGMASKLEAVKLAVEEGVETVIANGRRPDRLAKRRHERSRIPESGGNSRGRLCDGAAGPAGSPRVGNSQHRSEECHPPRDGDRGPGPGGGNPRGECEGPGRRRGERIEHGDAGSSPPR
jgi:glutamate 5-kinase